MPGSVFFIYLPMSGKYSMIKKVEKYYVLSRDGTGCVIPLGACFCAGAILILVSLMSYQSLSCTCLCFRLFTRSGTGRFLKNILGIQGILRRMENGKSNGCIR